MSTMGKMNNWLMPAASLVAGIYRPTEKKLINHRARQEVLI